MCARETREKIVQRDFVHQIHDCYFPAQGVAVFLPYAIGAQGDVEKVARRDAGWISVCVVRSARNYVNQPGAIVGRSTCPQRLIEGRERIAAIYADLLLLIARKGKSSPILS